MQKPYTPIACQFVDYIEHFATLRKPVDISFRMEHGMQMRLISRIHDTSVEDGVEYMHIDDHKIRMDNIISIDRHQLAEYQSCEVPQQLAQPIASAPSRRS